MTENHTEYGRLHPDYGTELRPDSDYGTPPKTDGPPYSNPNTQFGRVRREGMQYNTPHEEPNPQAKYALLDFVLNAMNKGLMVDLRPTVKFMNASEVYHWFSDYLDRVDKDLRDRARSALNTHQQYKASQNKPAREEIDEQLKEQVLRLTREKDEAYEKGVQEALKNARHNPAIRERMRLQYEDGVRDGRDQVLANADNQYLRGHAKGYKDGFKDGREGAITELATVVLTKKKEDK